MHFIHYRKTLIFIALRFQFLILNFPPLSSLKFRLVSDTQNNKENSPISTVEGDVVKTKEGYESLNSALEAELKDIRERYFHISLKYAEVEHQREELVMKLKAAKNSGRRWFS